MHFRICVFLLTIYRCDCVDGYTGVFCETDINECDDTPCQNDGICSDLLDDYTCKCTDGFSGKNCEKGTYIQQQLRLHQQKCCHLYKYICS